MDAIIGQIVNAGNIAVLVLMAGCIGLYRMYRDERRQEREARTADAEKCAAATDRQTEAVRELATVLVDLRLQMAAKRSGKGEAA